jgi:hypothetical protein
MWVIGLSLVGHLEDFLFPFISPSSRFYCMFVIIGYNFESRYFLPLLKKHLKLGAGRTHAYHTWIHDADPSEVQIKVYNSTSSTKLWFAHVEDPVKVVAGFRSKLPLLLSV